MKRTLSVIVIFAFALCLFACSDAPAAQTESTVLSEATQSIPETSAPEETVPVQTAPKLEYTVANPTPLPDYSVPENYTTDDLRQIAVRAMRDILTVEWTPAKYYTYKNKYDWPDKQFQYVTGQTFNGMPYANAHTGIFQWYKFYDPETGILDYPGTGQQWGEDLGTVCADCILWAWSTVCNSYDSITYTYHMTPGNNFVGTGTYTLPDGITSFRAQTTDMICEFNGIEGMAQAYAQLLPADALTSTSDGHAVMIIRPSEVVYKEDGTIDVDNSYIFYQDQSGGTSNHFNEVEENGEIHYYVGHTDTKFTFANAFKRGFIPITTQEFLGTKEYTPADASYEGGSNSVNDLFTATIYTNYPLCSAELLAEDTDGNRSRIAIDLFTKMDGGNHTGEEGYTYHLTGLEFGNAETIKRDYPDAVKAVLVAQVSTGDEFELISFDLR